MKTLILGGVRSGKSRLAERLARESALPVTCIATAIAGDEEMRSRIEAHRRRRPRGWRVIEEPLALPARLRECAGDGRCVVVDCLTLWLTNLLVNEDETTTADACKAMYALLPALTGEILLVSNETNMGVVPTGALARRFCDLSGRMHQKVAQCCDRVVLTVAGLPLILKGGPL